MMKQNPSRALAAAAMMLSLTLARADYRELGYRYLSPLPGAEYCSPQTRFVLVRFADVSPSNIANLASSFIAVTGAISGSHTGQTHVATDGRTVIFEMSKDFTNEELVTVSLAPQLAPGAGGTVAPYQYQFMIGAPMAGPTPLAVPQTDAPIPSESASCTSVFPNTLRSSPHKNSLTTAAQIMPNGVSVPGDFPRVVITVNDNPSPGCLFLENVLGGFQPYTMILDNHGLPVWYRRGLTYNFQVLQNGMITWCVGDGSAGFPAFDQNFNYLRTYAAVNGYLTDFHDLKVRPDGSYFLIGYRLNAVDMSRYVAGGNPSASVRETVVQGFTAEDELVFQWRAWDHYDIRDLGGNTDFPHMNSIDIDDDGNLLVSARYLSEVTKVDRDSGEILWHLGGPHSSFTFLNDPLNGISYQHDISALGHGHYMVFDNGNDHEPQVSRAVEYELDLTNRTARLFWQFRDTPDKYTYWRGNAQRLPTGNTLINFSRADYPKAIEVDSNGVKRFELSLVPSSDAYKAVRFPWHGVVTAPYLITEPQPDNLTLVFNKFGDTNVAYYCIYGGTDPHPTNMIATSPVTMTSLTHLENQRQYYFRVTAVGKNGTESEFSNEQSVFVNLVKPGQNILLNGQFALGTNSWNWTVAGSASATWIITNEASDVEITSPGTQLTDIQLKQAGLELMQGKEYVVSFDAWSAAPRVIEVRLAQNQSPGTAYCVMDPSLTPIPTRFNYAFTMASADDLNACLMFNLGVSPGAVYLDNVSLFQVAPGDFNRDGCVDVDDLSVLTSLWLQQGSGLTADLNGDGKVDFDDFAIMADDWSGTNCP